jgi:methyl-accepting chemotaxis protein
MKLGMKLLLAPLLTALVAFTAGQVNALLLTREAAANVGTFHSGAEHYKTLTSVQDQLGQIHAGVYRTVTLIASLDEAKLKAHRADLAQQLEGVKRTLGGVAAGEDVGLGAPVSEAQTQIDKYLKLADSAIDLSSVDPNTGIAALQGADATFAALAKTVRGMAGRVDEHTAAATEASQQRSQRISLLLAAIGLLAAGAAVGASWAMQRKLVGELGRASAVANAVAAGDLSVDAHSDRRDEVGDLLRALDRMAHQLNDSVHTVFGSSQSIQTATAEIAGGNQDLRQRTVEAAGSLQQTAASMEQLTGTVRQTAESAQTAQQLAESASAAAAKGEDVVSQVVSTMDEIQASSRRIADIIGVIDGIAFQTNILALNAAVEAARAGDQGRGFAVVAGEVRNLAQRSAGAAREIKSLIEVSVDRVASGNQLVQSAGGTMQEIMASVQRVTDIIGEITAAASAQSSGLVQVNGAVTQLDRMTQENAAMVQHSAAAADRLKDQAAHLARVVQTFHLRAAA